MYRFYDWNKIIRLKILGFHRSDVRVRRMFSRAFSIAVALLIFCKFSWLGIFDFSKIN